MASSTIVRKQYDRVADVYDWLWRGYIRRTLPLLSDAARVAPGERVLDVGSGTGALEERLAGSLPDVEIVGVDASPAMVDRARRKLRDVPSVSFACADAHALPFQARSFDAVVSASTFHYLAEPGVFLEEAARVLHPGGRLVLLDWCRDFWTCRVMDAVLRRFDPAHDQCYTLGEMQNLVANSPLSFQRGARHSAGLVWGLMTIEALCLPGRHRPDNP